MDATLTQEWSGRDDGQAFRLLALSELWQGRVDGQVELYRLWGDWVVSEPLLRISILLGAFAGLIFAAEVLTDRELRADVIDDLLDEWHATLKAWRDEPLSAVVPARPARRALADKLTQRSAGPVPEGNRRDGRVAPWPTQPRGFRTAWRLIAYGAPSRT